MSRNILRPARLPEFDTIQWGEYLEGGMLNARLSNRSRRKGRASVIHDATIVPDCVSDIPPSPPGPSAASSEPLPNWELRIEQRTYFTAMTYLTARTPEAAGILLGARDDESLLITEFVPDAAGRGTAVSFELDASGLNQVLKEKKTDGLTCLGIVHSHPAGITHPSCGDLFYFRKLFAVPANGEAQHLFVPIICGGRMYPYVFAQNEIHPAKLVLV